MNNEAAMGLLGLISLWVLDKDIVRGAVERITIAISAGEDGE